MTKVNFLIAYNCMKQLKDTRTNLFPAIAEVCKIRGNGQDLQLERSKWHNRKKSFIRRIALHWNELILEMVTTFEGFSYLARENHCYNMWRHML